MRELTVCVNFLSRDILHLIRDFQLYFNFYLLSTHENYILLCALMQFHNLCVSNAGKLYFSIERFPSSHTFCYLRVLATYWFTYY